MVGIHFFPIFCAFWSSMASSGALFYLFPSPPSLHINASLAHNGDPGAEIPLIQLRSIGQVSSQDMWQSMWTINGSGHKWLGELHLSLATLGHFHHNALILHMIYFQSWQTSEKCIVCFTFSGNTLLRRVEFETFSTSHTCQMWRDLRFPHIGHVEKFWKFFTFGENSDFYTSAMQEIWNISTWKIFSTYHMGYMWQIWGI